MTRRNYSKQSKTRSIFTLAIISLLCFVLLFSVACNKPAETKKDDPTYNYTETDDGVIKNSSFTYGTTGSKLSSYPKTSPNGWSLTKDSSANSSAKSGVIDVTDEGWDELLGNLYNDPGILNYIKHVFDFDNDDIIEKIKTSTGQTTTPTSKEIKEYVVENYMKTHNSVISPFENPKTFTGSEDSKIYMLNNYKTGDAGYGSKQNIKTSDSVTLKKGQYAKVSVYVCTRNFTDIYTGEEGAFIAVESQFNNNKQADFAITDIRDKDWTQYTFYVKADDVFETKFNLVLGFGYEHPVEGTAYFDEISVTHLTETEYKADIASKTEKVSPVSYIEDEKVTVKGTDALNPGNVYLCDLSLDAYVDGSSDNTISDVFPADFIKSAPILIDADHNYFTKSDIEGITGQAFGEEKSKAAVSSVTFTDEQLKTEKIPYGIKSATKLHVENASYTIKLDNNGSDFALNPEEYAYISFFVKNELSDFGSTGISINVYDINDPSEKTGDLREGIVTLTKVDDEWQKCSVIVKNNFVSGSARQFYIEIIVGPAKVSSQNIIDYAFGDVYFTKPVFTTDSTIQYTDDAKTEEKPNYKFFKLFSSTANGSTSLYSGYNTDYQPDKEKEESFSLDVAPSDLGVILTRPATPENYDGIIDKHGYINEQFGDNFIVNTNNNAGLINTKYLNAYDDIADLSDIQTALNHSGEDNIQPLMIKNKELSNYGFVGIPSSISASSFAKISVKVKVVDDAIAYVYLVDTSKANKEVMSFEKYDNNLKLEFKVTSDMMNDGWATVTFYIATGTSQKNFRLELWNGSRDGKTKSAGYVFFNDITVSTTGGFTEPARYQDALTTPGNPLSDSGLNAFKPEDLKIYRRELTETEKQYNKENPKTPVVYDQKYIWAKNDNMIYSIFNTVDPVIVDPYEKDTDNEETKPEDEKEVDPSVFWMSFSSILLGVALAAAIIALIVKNVIRKRKANASDAKSHYTVKSRNVKDKKIKEDKPQPEITNEEPEEPEILEEPTEEKEELKPEEQTLDSYVYGDVQDFGDSTDNSDKPEDKDSDK